MGRDPVGNGNAATGGRVASLAREGESFEISQWLHYSTFDVVGEIAVCRTFRSTT